MSNNKTNSDKNTDESKNLSETNASRAVKKTFDLYTSESFTSPLDNLTPTYEEDSLEALNPDLQDSLMKIQRTVKKDKVNKLLNRDKDDNRQIFGTGENLSPEQQSTVLKKLNKWESSQEINVANASVVVSWMEKFGKKLK